MEIGRNEQTLGKFEIDLPVLIETRLLIQANSGGGKSWAIRKLLETTFGKVQHIVLDIEGEFVTLREKFDYVICGKDGDIPLNLKTADLLAKKLLELNVSAIIDLYELKHHERILFVKRFLDALVNSNKELWHPVLVVVDEAHIFCPEQGKAESASSVIDLATRGRKRGFCSALATQRLSKLNKDAAAECNNKLIGRTGLDVDMKRASDELGFSSKDDMRAMRNLEAGEFFAFGPAFSRSVVKIKIGSVQTSHPKIGARYVAVVPQAKGKILAALEKLKELPLEAEKNIQEVDYLRSEIVRLKGELKEKPRPQVIIPATTPIKENNEELHRLRSSMQKIRALVGINEKPEMKVVASPKILEVETKPLRSGAMKLLGVLAQFDPVEISKEQLGVFAGFSSNGGTFNTYISELKRNGWIVENNKLFSITKLGYDSVGEVSPLPRTRAELIDLWASKFRSGAAKILRALTESYPIGLDKEEIGAKTGFAFSGGTFLTYLSELKRTNLIEQEGQIFRASRWLMEGSG